MKRVILLLAVFAAAVSFACREGSKSEEGFEVRVSQGEASATVTVELARTVSERQQGLMFRQELAEDAGMLFLHPEDVRSGFWMKNTYVPLDIAYISSGGEVLEVHHGKPLDETVLQPKAPYRYVLEVNHGWFERHGLGPGARVELPAGLPAAE